MMWKLWCFLFCGELFHLLCGENNTLDLFLNSVFTIFRRKSSRRFISMLRTISLTRLVYFNYILVLSTIYFFPFISYLLLFNRFIKDWISSCCFKFSPLDSQLNSLTYTFFNWNFVVQKFKLKKIQSLIS